MALASLSSCRRSRVLAHPPSAFQARSAYIGRLLTVAVVPASRREFSLFTRLACSRGRRTKVSPHAGRAIPPGARGEARPSLHSTLCLCLHHPRVSEWEREATCLPPGAVSGAPPFDGVRHGVRRKLSDPRVPRAGACPCVVAVQILPRSLRGYEPAGRTVTNPSRRWRGAHPGLTVRGSAWIMCAGSPVTRSRPKHQAGAKAARVSGPPFAGATWAHKSEQG